MARCEVCGRKIKPTQRFCGPKDCKNQDNIFPRCLNCGQIITEDTDPRCPYKKQPHVPDNENAAPSHANYVRKVA